MLQTVGLKVLIRGHMAPCEQYKIRLAYCLCSEHGWQRFLQLSYSFGSIFVVCSTIHQQPDQELDGAGYDVALCFDTSVRETASVVPSNHV